MSLRTYQEKWHRVFHFSAPKADHERVADYQGFVLGHYRGIIEKMYPRIARVQKALLSEGRISEFYELFPPTHFELNHLSQRYADYLRKCKEAAPYFSELADYEWTEFSVYLHPSDEIAIRDSLSRGEIALNPTLHLLSFAYDIPQWVQSMDLNPEEAQGSSPERAPTLLAIVRSPENGSCVFTKLNSSAASILYSLSETEGPRSKQTLLDGGIENPDLIDVLIQQSILLEGVPT